MAKRQRNLRKRQLAVDDDEKDDGSAPTESDVAIPLRQAHYY